MITSATVHHAVALLMHDDRYVTAIRIQRDCPRGIVEKHDVDDRGHIEMRLHPDDWWNLLYDDLITYGDEISRAFPPTLFGIPVYA